MKAFKVFSLLLLAMNVSAQYNLQNRKSGPYDYQRPEPPPKGYLPPSSTTRKPYESQTNISPDSQNPPTDDTEHEPGMPYDFAYAVKDDYGNDFEHKADSDGEVVQGEFRTLLPDGRMQVVKYTADWKNGYNAEVTYEGEPTEPVKPRCYPGSTDPACPPNCYPGSTDPRCPPPPPVTQPPTRRPPPTRPPQTRPPPTRPPQTRPPPTRPPTTPNPCFPGSTDPRCPPNCFPGSTDPRCPPPTRRPPPTRPPTTPNPCFPGSTDPRCPPDCFPGSQDPRCPRTTTQKIETEEDIDSQGIYPTKPPCEPGSSDPRCPPDCYPGNTDPRCPQPTQPPRCYPGSFDPRCPKITTEPPTEPPGLYGAPSLPFGTRNHPKFGYGQKK